MKPVAWGWLHRWRVVRLGPVLLTAVSSRPSPASLLRFPQTSSRFPQQRSTDSWRSEHCRSRQCSRGCVALLHTPIGLESVPSALASCVALPPPSMESSLIPWVPALRSVPTLLAFEPLPSGRIDPQLISLLGGVLLLPSPAIGSVPGHPLDPWWFLGSRVSRQVSLLGFPAVPNSWWVSQAELFPRWGVSLVPVFP